MNRRECSGTTAGKLMLMRNWEVWKEELDVNQRRRNHVRKAARDKQTTGDAAASRRVCNRYDVDERLPFPSAPSRWELCAHGDDSE